MTNQNQTYGDCPTCRVPLKDPNNCGCGWQKGKSTDHSMPTINDLKAALIDFITRWPQGKVPDRLKHADAADWFLKLLEPHKPHEAPHKVTVQGRGNETHHRWIWVYETRVKNCLAIYLTFSYEQQKTIVAAREDKIFWRGDDFDYFMDVVNETLRMRYMGIAEYRKQCLERMGNIKTSNGKVVA